MLDVNEPGPNVTRSAPRRHLRVLDARPEPTPVGGTLLEALERPFVAAERLSSRLIPTELNPITQSGAVANFTFVLAIISGVLLLFWYVPSLHQAWDSLDAMRGSPWTAELARSVHRYASDACMLFVLIHSVRYAAGRRFGGARWVAWVTGIFAIGVLWFVGWIGYWLVWDERAQLVAIGSARALDVLPIFTDPLGRSFLSDQAINSLLFFIVFFAHMILPLACVLALYLHLTRLSRATWMTGLKLSAWIGVSLIVLSLVYPATSVEPARMLEDPEHLTIDWWYLAPLYLTDRLGGGAIWAVFLGLGVVLFSVPWWAARRRPAAATVDEAKCNACERCVDDCPYGAIVMAPRTDGKELSGCAQVDAKHCVGCGICAGSCDSAGIGLDWIHADDVRKKLDGWIERSVAGGDAHHVAFLCASSAAAQLTIDPGDGTCADLPGYVVCAVPCAGWVHALTIERALRHGAPGVLVAACGDASCAFREGAVVTDMRMEREREPMLRESVDRSLVRVVHLDAGQRGALKRSAAAFRKEHSAPPAKAPGIAKVTLVGLGIGLTITAITGVASDLPYTAPVADHPELVVSFKHRGASDEQCREPTAAELAETPLHMRREQICERGRAPVRLQLRVDGEILHDQPYEASGLFSDGPSVGVVRVPMEAGMRDVSLRIAEQSDSEDWAYEEQREVEFGPRERHVLRFNRRVGFEWD